MAIAVVTMSPARASRPFETQVKIKATMIAIVRATLMMVFWVLFSIMVVFFVMVDKSLVDEVFWSWRV